MLSGHTADQGEASGLMTINSGIRDRIFIIGHNEVVHFIDEDSGVDRRGRDAGTARSIDRYRA